MGARERQGVSIRRMVVEGVVIVGSILLAFGIDAWWDTRQRNSANMKTIAGLEAAFSENTTGIQEHLELLEDLSRHIEFFLESEPGDLAGLHPHSAHRVLTAVQRQGTASLNNEYLTELVDATDLSEYPEVAAVVADWRRWAFGLRERRELLVAQGESIVQEAGKFPELIPHMARLQRAHRDAEGLARLRANPVTVSQVTAKAQSWWLYAGYFQGMQDASLRLVAMLQDLQAR